MRTLNLDALETMQNTVTKGVITYAVRPITPLTASMIDAATEAPDSEKALLYYNAVAKIVPTMPRAEVDDLSVTQVLAIVEMAGEQVGIVQEAADDPNAASSTEAPTPPSAPDQPAT